MKRMMRRVTIVGTVAAVLVLTSTAGAWALDPSIDINAKLKSANTALGLNNLWIVIGAVLVIFMQAGFALVETGFCRAKHAAHVMSTNFAIFGLGFVAFFIVGFPIMFSGFSYPGYFGYDSPLSPDRLIGFGDWTFLWGRSGFALTGVAYSVPVAAFFLYMVAFMDTTATIPTGAMAERWKWKAFVGWGLFCGALYYPIFGGWTWGGGWLSQLGNNIDLGFGYVDFAGSGVVHAMGGIAGLAGAVVLGARIGKYGPDGKPRTLAAHSIPMAMLGTFILLFGWFGFNAASTLAATDLRFTVVAVNTALAAAFGATAAMFYCMKRMGKPDPGHDGERHARRPRGDHGAVRVRAAVGGSGDRHHRRRAHRRVGASSSSARGSTTRWVRSPCTEWAASSVCCASGSSPTAGTARRGTSPTPRRRRARASPASCTGAASCSAAARSASSASASLRRRPSVAWSSSS